MKKLLLQSYKHLAKIKVIHNIPGRLRLSIPGLKNLKNSNYLRYEHVFYSLIKKIPGISHIDSSYVSGNLLIEYNTSIINDSEILKWLNVTRSKLIDYFMEDQVLQNIVSEEDIVEQLKLLIENEISRLNNGNI